MTDDPALKETYGAVYGTLGFGLIFSFLGTMLGVGAALVAELSQRRIRSAEDLALALDLPVLVEMDSATPAPKKGFRFWLNKKPANSESGQGTHAIGQKQAAVAEA